MFGFHANSFIIFRGSLAALEREGKNVPLPLPRGDGRGNFFVPPGALNDEM